MSSAEILKKSYLHGNSYINNDAILTTTPQNGYLFGHPIAHSMAPLFYNLVWKQHSLPWKFSLYDSMDFEDAFFKLKTTPCIGASVTMPHKIRAMQRVDDLTQEARDIGAVNTIFMRRDRNTGATRYIGGNTDCIGIRDALISAFPTICDEVRGKVGMVVGGGATTRTAIYALWKYFDIRVIYIVDRLASEADAVIKFARGAGYDGELTHVRTLEQAETCQAPAIVVGAVPDIPPQTEGEVEAIAVAGMLLSKLDASAGQVGGYLLDMCYHPSPLTTLARTGLSKGWRFVSGLEALIRQGVAQSTLWMERVPDVRAIEEAASAVRARHLGPAL